MRIIICDLCEEAIKDRTGEVTIQVNSPLYHDYSLCPECAKPVTEFLKENWLVEKSK